MWFGLTIARSSPASTQWWRKTELRIARAFGETPNDTFDTPSEVFTPGSSFLMRLMPSIVATAEGLHSSSPVVSVNVSASKISASRSSPCSSQASSTMRLATSSLRSGVFAMPTSSIVSAITRGAVRLGERDDRVELVAAGLEVDRVDDRPARDALERGLDHVRLGRVDLERRRLRERHALRDLGHLHVLVLALGERDAEVEHVRAAGHLVLGDLEDAVVVVGEQQLLGLARALRVHALADERGPRLLHERRGGHHRGDERLAAAPGAAAPRGRRRGPRSPRCGPASCRSSRRRWRRRSAPRTPGGRSRAGRAPRGRSSRRPGPGAAGRRSGCSAPAAGWSRRGSGSRRACPRGRSSSSARSRPRRAR